MKNIILSMFLLVILVGTASAFEFDNVKSYDDKTKTVLIENAFGLGDDIAEIQLNTPLINYVGYGQVTKVAEFEVRSFDNYNNAFNELELYDKRNSNQKFTRDYDYKVLTYEDVVIDDYEFVGLDKNNEPIRKLIGNHTIQREKWIDFNVYDFANGENLTIGIFTFVENGDYVEWIPNLFGVRIDEWAVWTVGLNTGLLDYYNFEDTTFNLTDVVNYDNNGTLFGNPSVVTGIIGNALNFSASSYANVTNATFGNGASDGTICYWARAPTDNVEWVFGSFLGAPASDTYGAWGGNSVKARLVIGNTVNSNTTTTIGNWNHWCNLWGTGGMQMFQNGIIVGNDTDSDAPIMTTGYHIGARKGDAVGTKHTNNISIDEMGIWNRRLSVAEITDLYNGGVGITYSSLGPTITLISPINAFNTTNNTIDFKGNVTSQIGIINVTLYIDGIKNETNSSGINNTDYNFTKIISMGGHNWTYVSCNTNTCITETTRTFSISNWVLNSENYTSSLSEGTSSLFTINITTNGTDITIGNLSYNGTGNIGDIFQTGNIFIINKTITAPITNEDVNITFFWNITQEDGNYTVTSSKNQTILNLNVDNCSINTNVLYNFTNVDEEDQTLISASNVTSQIDLSIYNTGRTEEIANFSKEYTTTNPFAVCFNSTMGVGEQYVADVQVKYFGDIHEREFYHIQNSSITTDDFPTNITLYDLKNASSTSFEITFKDASFLPVEDALIQIQRKYIDEGLFKVIEIPKTDTEGKTIGHFVLQDIIYTIIVVKNGETLGTFNDVRVVCQNPTLEECIIPLNAVTTTIQPEDFTQLDDFTFTLDYNKTSREVESIYTIPSSSVATVILNVTLSDALGNTTVCYDSLTSSAGTLQCNVPSSFGNTSVRVELLKDNVIQGSGIIYLTPKPSDTFGENLVFIGIFLYMTLIGIAISSSPMITAFFLILGAILGVSLNFVSGFGFIGAGATILWLIIAIIITLVKGQSRS